MKEKTVEEKVLATLPVHILLIILAVTSVWKFQQWKTDYRQQTQYEKVRAGNAPILEKNYYILAQKYPELGKNYRRIASEELIIRERIGAMLVFQRQLKNPKVFINQVMGRWDVMLSQLGRLKNFIKFTAVSQGKSVEVVEQLSIDINKNINQTFADILENRRHTEALMRDYADSSTQFLVDATLDDPGYAISSLSRANYRRVIQFFKAEYQELIIPLDVITKDIRASSQIIADLKYKIKKKRVSRQDPADDVLFEWEYTREYSRLRLLKILNAIETQYVLREMGMKDQHPAMQKLQQAIAPMIKHYSQKVHERWQKTKENSNPDLVLAQH